MAVEHSVEYIFEIGYRLWAASIGITDTVYLLSTIVLQMCRTYNTIGSLTSLKTQLANNNIRGFKSLRDVMDFQKSYAALREELIAHHQKLIEQEQMSLGRELPELEIAIEKAREQAKKRLTQELDELRQKLNHSIDRAPSNIFQRLAQGFRHRNYKKAIKTREDNFELDVHSSVYDLTGDFHFKTNRYQFISSNFKEAVRQSAQDHLSELERKKAVVDSLNSFIYGALGEQKVVKTLESLSDDYFLINDFSIRFSPAIYNRQENDHIGSVQIDHILVGPSGVFLIETKNWSEQSLANLSLRSPVQQIKRTSFALFMLLNNEVRNFYSPLEKHHWGDRKISIRNLIVLTNTKPREEFQYVKVLTLNELLSYVNYFKPVFSNFEAHRIADFLLDINSRKTFATN